MNAILAPTPQIQPLTDMAINSGPLSERINAGAPRVVAPYHDRMPLALADDKVEAWLDLERADPLADDLLLDLQSFGVRPMDRAMNNAKQKDLGAIDPDRTPA
ncbi:MAG: hypothetical protein NVSMB18_33950 [Acetobacteraceae bacterium]